MKSHPSPLLPKRLHQLDESFSQNLESVLQSEFALSLKDSGTLAEYILQLSDFYIAEPTAATPWQERWCQIAYLAYYFPLNALRAQAVIAEGLRHGFFSDLRKVVDFGSGLGSATYFLPPELQKSAEFTNIENSPPAQKLHQALSGSQPVNWQSDIKRVAEKTLAVFSYALTELDTPPDWLLECENLMIIEPATREHGRRLLEFRADLLSHGFHAWAPCTHQQACPLLAQTKTDWCHDRIHFKAPDWFAAIEKLLPMKNQTLTFSYLLMSKRPPPNLGPNAARTTGDLLMEKGKSRQMVCRGPQREYLAWMHREIQPEEIPRGSLILWPEDGTSKANEIRLHNPVLPCT